VEHFLTCPAGIETLLVVDFTHLFDCFVALVVVVEILGLHLLVGRGDEGQEVVLIQ
jgi:hypothetical protein